MIDTMQKGADTNVGDQERAISALGGGALALLGLARGPAGLAISALGGYLVYRGLTGRDPVYQALSVNTAKPGGAVRVHKAMSILRPREELYRYWRKLENLPLFMHHLEKVEELGPHRSLWTAKAPAGTTVSWEAEITEDRPGEVIAWRSLPDSTVYNTGEVRFEQAPGDRGTQVRVILDYTPPAGVVGAAVARLLGEEPSRQIEEELRHFKQLMETGEIATVKGQPHGKRTVLGKFANALEHADEPEPQSQQGGRAQFAGGASAGGSA